MILVLESAMQELASAMTVSSPTITAAMVQESSTKESLNCTTAHFGEITLIVMLMMSAIQMEVK